MAIATETRFALISLAFANKGHIPSKYTCERENVNPPLEFNHLPTGTKSIAIIVEDHDAPKGIFDHWIVWNIQPNEVIDEKYKAGIAGRNSFGNNRYDGPCPPSGVHRYFFKAFALDKQLDLPAGSKKDELMQAMHGHIIGNAELLGLYSKKMVKDIF